MTKLVVARPTGDIRVYPLKGGSVTLGRDPECVVRLGGRQVSRVHCRLDPLPDGRYRLLDLVSTNGTYLNGKRVSGVVLERYDLLRVGDAEAVLMDDDDDPQAILAKVRALGDWTTSFRADTVWRAAGVPSGLGRQEALKEAILQLSLVSKNLLSQEEVLRVLETILREIMHFTGLGRGAILLEQDRGGLGQALEVALEGDAGTDAAAPEALVEEAVRRRRPVERRLEGPQGPVRGLCLPLDAAPIYGLQESGERRRRSVRILGAFLLLGPAGGRSLEPQDRQLLELVAAQAAIVLQRAWLYRQASLDHLTQLANRACMQQVLEEELGVARSRGAPLAVLLFDIDHFKRVNDTWGHPTGDAVLREVARRVRGALRQTDPVARWGGEEFLVLLPGEELDGAQVVAEKLREAVSQGAVGEEEVTVTISVGVAAFPRHGTRPDELVAHADEALYAAKALGRDRVIGYEPGLELVARLPRDHAPAAPGQTACLDTDPAPVRRGDTRSLPAVSEEEEPELWVSCPPLAPVSLRGSEVRIGRSASCELVLHDGSVSRIHAILRRGGERWLLEDQGSTNGTFLNGLPVCGPTHVRAGDVLTVGDFQVCVLEGADLEERGTVSAATRVRHLSEETPLSAVLRELERAGHSGRVDVLAGSLRGRMELQEGRVVASELGGQTGHVALRDLLFLDEGLCCIAGPDEPARVQAAEAHVRGGRADEGFQACA